MINMKCFCYIICGLLVLQVDNYLNAADNNRKQDDIVILWSNVALNAVAEDHSHPELGADQGGPARTSRALAMVHLAMFDAANCVKGDYNPYLSFLPKFPSASYDVSVAYAAFTVLAELYPSQSDIFELKLKESLNRDKNKNSSSRGKALGTLIGQSYLYLRAFDGSDDEMSYTPGDLPGQHRVDPLHPDQGYLNPQWGEVSTFALKSLDAVQIPPPPSLTSAEFALAFNEVKLYGARESAVRTLDQEIIGIFWGYDGTIGLGTPPRLYNQVVHAILEKNKFSSIESARMLALVNMAMADAGIAAWHDKFEYSFWRPIVAIREADAGTGPSGLGDNNPDTAGDVNWEPLGAPASNLTGTDFTPPFPAYASGHATFGAASFHVVRRLLNTDKINLDFVSDEYNGVTTDSAGNIRPRVSRHYDTLTQMIEENGQSRVYLGIHWSFDKTSGVTQGTQIANECVDNFLTKKRKR